MGQKLMDLHTLTNPWVLAGGAALTVVFVVSHGSARGSNGGMPSYADVMGANLQSAQIGLEFSKVEASRQTQQTGQALSAYTSMRANDNARAVAETQSYNGVINNTITSNAALSAANNENWARLQAVRISDAGATGRAVIDADTKRYVAKKQSQASIWTGALSALTKLAGTAATAATGVPVG